MRIHSSKLFKYHFFAALSISIFTSSAFANDILTLKVLCDRTDTGMMVPAPKNNGECQPESLILTSSDIKCITPSVKTEETQNIDSMMDMFSPNSHFAKKADKANTTRKKINTVMITLTDSAANKLTQFTEKNIGRRVSMSYNNEVLAAPVMASPLSSSFQVTHLSAKTFKHMKSALSKLICDKPNNAK